MLYPKRYNQYFLHVVSICNRGLGPLALVLPINLQFTHICGLCEKSFQEALILGTWEPPNFCPSRCDTNFFPFCLSRSCPKQHFDTRRPNTLRVCSLLKANMSVAKNQEAVWTGCGPDVLIFYVTSHSLLLCLVAVAERCRQFGSRSGAALLTVPIILARLGGALPGHGQGRMPEERRGKV